MLLHDCTPAHSEYNAPHAPCRPLKRCLPAQREYLGNVTVRMDCTLEDVSGSKLVLPSAPLQFSVVPNVAVRSAAHGDGAPAPAPDMQL